MHVGAQQDTVGAAGVDVDVRIDAALADQSEPGQSLEQVGLNARAFAEQYQGLGVGVTARQRIAGDKDGSMGDGATASPTIHPALQPHLPSRKQRAGIPQRARR